MPESREVIQFAGLIRRAVEKNVQNGQELLIWLGGTREEVRQGKFPALLLDELCPVCGGLGPHVLEILQNWQHYTCLNCRAQHTEQMATSEKGRNDG